MNSRERHDEFQRLASELADIQCRIERLIPELQFLVDQKAARHIGTSLAWSAENCTVIGLHQIGEALDDAMGITGDGKVR